jgi:DNA-binding CsgD family transcriptional regulator
MSPRERHEWDRPSRGTFTSQFDSEYNEDGERDPRTWDEKGIGGPLHNPEDYYDPATRDDDDAEPLDVEAAERELFDEAFRLEADYADREPERRTEPAPADPFRRLLAERLTEAEREHWAMVERGLKQSAIVKRFGIAQPTVAKRERKLRGKVDALYREAHGRPYPWPGGAPGMPRRPGARGPGNKVERPPG